jgi:hypothetical protein
LTVIYQVGHLERLPLGTPNPSIVAHVGQLLGKLPAGTELAIDLTGIGNFADPRYVIGVDLRQSRDPTAIAVVRRVEFDPDEKGRRLSPSRVRAADPEGPRLVDLVAS